MREDGGGRPVVLVHADSVALGRMAVFDVIANNADRKGGHVLTDEAGRTWGIDHGVTFAAEEKLRTVLWGWAGAPIPSDVLADVAALHDRLGVVVRPGRPVARRGRARRACATAFAASWPSAAYPHPRRALAGHPVARLLTPRARLG